MNIAKLEHVLNIRGILTVDLGTSTKTEARRGGLSKNDHEARRGEVGHQRGEARRGDEILPRFGLWFE